MTLQTFGNFCVLMERFTKYYVAADKTSTRFFNIVVAQLLGPDALLLEENLMILIEGERL